jgi:G3E family GTPase
MPAAQRPAVSTVAVGGYLGAGKTTLINHALATAGTRRVGVIVNDFGRLNVDASLLQTQGAIELANGCVCCTLADGLPAAFETLLARTPPLDAIVIEASGVADPRKIAGYAKLAGLHSPSVVVVVDAINVRELARDRFVGGEIERQIRSAGLLVLNKRDAVDDATAASLVEWLRARAPETPIVEARHGCIDWPALLSGDGTSASPGGSAASDGEHDGSAYESWSFESDRPLNRVGVERFARAIRPHALRAKGTIALSEDPLVRYVFQLTPGTFALEPQDDWGNAPSRSSIVVIARGTYGLSTLCDALARTYLLGDPQ